MPSSKKSETSSEKCSPDSRAFPEEFFDRSLASGRLSHAYLLLGADTTGIVGFCRRLARRLFCRSGCPPDRARCAPCKRVESGNHPDFHHLQPKAPGGKVRIELTREIRRAVNMSCFEAPCKVVVIEHAERMTEAAQNQVLKTLEEPPDGTLLLLVAPTAAGLLPTVISRCVPVRFTAPAAEEIGKTLASKDEREGNIAWAARAAAGSAERARLLLERDAAQFNGYILGALSRREPAGWAEFSERLLTFGVNPDASLSERRWWLRVKFDILAMALRDALLASLDIRGVRGYNVENSEEAGAIGEAYSTEEILDALALIADLQEKIERNLGMELVCDCLAQRLLGSEP
ncbi:MAG: hypothetical protein ABIH04_00120 [Planctomycetota bacterium]